MGITQFHGVVDVPPSIKPIFWQFDFSQVLSLDMLVVVFTFLFVDMFDTIGTVVGVTTKAGMVDEKGNPIRMNKAFMADAIGTVTGAMLGTSTVTTYVESASGVAQGGRSGLTAFSVACCLVLSLFFAPVFTAIPGAAVCPALVIVGLFMLSPIKDIPLDDYSEAIPAYLTIILMPMTYSISNGIMIGLISYVVLNLCTGRHKKVSWFMLVLAILFILKYIFL
jgi:AGZA family xanthine/uracil permease-like MFS transporter